MRKGDKGKKVLGLILIVILMFVGSIFSGVVAATTYDPQAAVNYADTWWNGRNPNYHDYSSEGGDCANFVSQCLMAGGLDLSGHPGADSWGCIPSCTNLHDYLVNYLGATYETMPKSQVEPIWFVPGDPAIFPTPKQAVFAVTGDATHYATCNAHSTDRYHKTIQWFFDNSNCNSCTYYHIPTTPPAPPTITSPGSSSGPGPTIDTLTPTLQWNSVSNSNADKYLYDMGIATGQSVGYYEPYQTQLDTELHKIEAPNQQPTAIIDSITLDPAEQGTDTVSFSGHGTDPDGTVEAYNWSSSIDGQLSTSASFNKPASELSVGTHTIYFKVQDNDGAWSTEDTADLTINPANQQPMAIIDSITTDPAVQGTDTVSFSGHGTDPDGTVETYNWSSSIDGPLSTSAAFTKPASELSVGTHTIYFKVQDNDGAWSTEDTADLTINPANVAPTAIIDSITPDPAEQGTDTVSFSGHGTDLDGTVEAYNWSSSIDGQLSTSAAFTKPASELSVGTHAIYFNVQDNDGTWSTEDTADLTINPANQQPTAIIDSITPDPAVQGTDTVSFTGNGTDTDGTVETYNWSSSIDGQLSTSAAFTKQASELSVGTHTIYFKVQDDDGTWSSEDTADLTINPANQQPTAIIDSITPDPAVQGTDTVSFTGNGTDTDGTVEAYNWSSSIDGQLSTSAAFTKQASELSVGTHTIYFKVQDTDGAWSSEDTEDLTINPANQQPTAIIDSITPDPAVQGTDTVSFTGNGTDTDGTVEAYNWSSSIDGQLSTSAAFTKQASELSVGTHTIYFKVQDNDGAWSTEDTADLTINHGPELSYSPESRDFCDMCEGKTDSTTFEIWNSGTDTLTYSLSEICDWLEVNPTSGSSTGEHNTITVDMDTTGLFEGSHTGDIKINSNDGSGTFTVMVNVMPCPCGNMSVNLTSWSTTLKCSELDNGIVTVSASDCIVNGVTVSKVSGPTWLSVSQTDLGDIASGSSETFTVTAAPPAGTSSGDYPYTIRVSNTCGSPSSRDVAGMINVNENADGQTDYWAVIVGVADYTGTSYDLAYTDDDAIDMYNTLLLSGDYWQPDHIVLLLDSEADRAGILTAFNWLDDNEDPDDVVLFFFSGHGTYDIDDDGDEADGYDELFCPYDFNNIRDDELDAELDRLGSTSIAVIIDTCFAGGMTKVPDRSVKTLPKQKVELTDGFAKDIQDEKKDMGDAGRVVLMACDDDEYSYEISLLENGLFSYYVIEALQGCADAEGNGDNICSAEETFVYAEPRVVDIISTQNPQLYDGYTGELPITRPPCPELSYSPTSHDFGDKCEGVTDSTTFELWNSGTGTLTYSLSETCDWLDVNPTSGSSTGEQDTITVDIDTTSLFEGFHTCDITINSNDGSGTFTVMVNVVSCPCGNMNVNPASWSTTILCGNTDNEIVTVSATGGTVKEVTVSKVSGPTWLSVSPTDLGDIASGSNKTFTITAAPPSETSGDFPYTITVSNTCGTPSTRDVSGTIHVSCPCGNMSVNPTSWSTTVNCSESDNEIVTVSATGGTVKEVTVSKVAGPTWLSVSPTDLGDIASGSNKTFTMTAAPPSETSGDFPYTITVSNTCGTPSTRDVSGTINVSCPCGNMGVNSTSWSTTLNCSESDNEIVTVSATGGTVKGVTGSKVSGPTWLSVSPTDLGDIASGSSKTFTMTTSPPPGISGDFPYTVTVSNTCGTPSTRDVAGTIHVDYPESSWTFMIYLDGDNNLESAAIGDFMEMSAVGSTSDVNIVVQFDRIPGYVSSYGDWTDCKRFHVTSGMTPTAANATEDLGECNMGDPNTLDAFVTWTMSNFPADNYALVLWNHGDGWKSINEWVPWADDIKDAKDAGLTRGICVDNTNNDYLSLQETEQALTGKYVQLLGYDACLMHMVEVVYQVMANAGVSVGSEEVEPGDGWPYDTILNDLTGTPTMNEDALGTVIVDRYMDSYGYTGSETQSAMDNALLPGLATAVDNLAQALMTEINAGHVADVQEARNAAEEIYYTYYIDLYHFAQKIQTNVPGAAIQAQAVMNEVSGSMYEAHGTSVPNDHGLSIYFPRVEGDYLASYDNTAFASDTQWDEFLKKYYNPPTQGADTVAFRNGCWYVSKEDHTGTDWTKTFTYGIPGDKPVIGDIDNNGIVDAVIFRNGCWYVSKEDHTGTDWTKTFTYGVAGDKPVIGDIDNNGVVDAVIFRNGCWYVSKEDHTGTDWTKTFTYGIPGDIPVMGDIDNNGIVDAVIFRNGCWYVSKEDHTGTDWTKTFTYGIPGDIPVMGDIDNNGIVDVVIFRNGCWYVSKEDHTGTDWTKTFTYGIPGDIPVIGDIG